MNEKFNYTLEHAEVNTILAALSELPYKVASPLIQKIVEQYNGQLPKAQPTDE